MQGDHWILHAFMQVNIRIDDMRRETNRRLTEIEKRSKKDEKPWQWLTHLPLGQMLTIATLIVSGFLLHFTPEEWREMLRTALQKK